AARGAALPRVPRRAQPLPRERAQRAELPRRVERGHQRVARALGAAVELVHPIENRFIPIPENVQFVAAVNRGREFSGTFGIDAAQLDRFAPLQMDYPPPKEEVKILRRRHPSLGQEIIESVVQVAHAIRRATEIGTGLSVRATDEACVYLEHPLLEGE